MKIEPSLNCLTHKISDTPPPRVFSPLRLLSPYTNDEIDALMRVGERQTWPRIEIVRICTQISRTLEEILERVDRGALEALT